MLDLYLVRIIPISVVVIPISVCLFLSLVLVVACLITTCLVVSISKSDACGLFECHVVHVLDDFYDHPILTLSTLCMILNDALKNLVRV